MNQRATGFLRKHEGCRLDAYRDVGGVWTIGYGATGQGIGEGLRWTLDEAEARLASDCDHAEAEVRKQLNPGLDLTDPQMAALISFVFNLGAGALASSHLVQLVNTRDFLGAAQEFQRWCHVGNKTVKGLLVRRLEEALLFLEGS